MSALRESIANHYMNADTELAKKRYRTSSLRMEVETFARLDVISKHLCLSRNQVIQILLDEGSHDALLEMAKLKAGEGDPTPFFTQFLNEASVLEAAYEHDKEAE